ncbi:MAG: hypothetical protein JSV91_12730 [Phycisphaerales bacterium]|nr:MAG: hypothetical protein JSV91_12730 [Phycisphaerales bacterium]
MPGRKTDNLEYSGRICDARGREVRVISPLRMRLLGRFEVIEREALNAILEDITPGFRRNLWFAIIILAITLVLTVGGIVTNCLMEGPGAWRDLVSDLKMMFPMFIACLIGGVVAPWIAVRQGRIKRTIAALLKHHRCLHCGYDLRSLPVDSSDGATACPECACVWRFEEFRPDDLRGDGSLTGSRSKRSVAILLALLGLLALAAAAGVLLVLR